MLDWFKSAARELGFLGYYRMLAEELSDPQRAKPVAPPMLRPSDP